MKSILLTGASGFIGQRYLSYNASKYKIKSVSLQSTQVEDIDFRGIDAIVHLAGKAHQMTPIEDHIYYDVNLHLTQKFAQAAKQAQVSQFIFISTVKVFGEETTGSEGLKETSPCKATDPYGKSKLQAEGVLQEMNDEQFQVAVVRPPLVYGPGVKGNMLRLLNLSMKGRVMPFGGIENERSMVFIDNLIELINSVTDQRANGIFHAGDRTPLSTSTLINSINKHMDNKGRLIKLNGIFLRILRWLKPGLVQRLWGSFKIETDQTNRQLNFNPPYESEEGIRQMVEWFKTSIK